MNKNDTVCDLTIIIPSYNPDEKLKQVCQGLKERGFHDIIIVNDGSDESHSRVFEEVQGCEVIHHQENKGKGSALKTAFRHVCEHRADTLGVITVDGDNQHLPEDVYACGEALLANRDSLILGCRGFGRKDIPLRSKVGNILTKNIMGCLCGIKISDTQTGLRAIPAKLLPFMMTIDGSRYEYETNMLLEGKQQGIVMIEVPIHTVYLQQNETSHFRVIRDSLKIYRVIFAFFFTSAFSSGIDLAIFFLMGVLLEYLKVDKVLSIYLSTIVARVCSSVCNYKINRKHVFRKGNSASVYRYYTLCICQLLVSASIVNGLAFLFVTHSFVNTLLKAITDTGLFFISFRIQKNWVFGSV